MHLLLATSCFDGVYVDMRRRHICTTGTRVPSVDLAEDVREKFPRHRCIQGGEVWENGGRELAVRNFSTQRDHRVKRNKPDVRYLTLVMRVLIDNGCD